MIIMLIKRETFLLVGIKWSGTVHVESRICIPQQLFVVGFGIVATQTFLFPWTSYQVSLEADEKETWNYQLLQFLTSVPQH